MTAALLVGRTGDVTRLALNRPEKANALSTGLIEALIDEVRSSFTNGTRLLVISGEDRNLCSGFDMSDLESASEGDLLRRAVRIEVLLQLLYHAPIATLAFAHGRNFGAGADLFAVCGTRVASPEASFRMPGLRFGLQLGTRRLAQRIGEEPARMLLAESTIFGAEEALRLRFATGIAPQAEWNAIVERTLASATALPPDSFARLLTATVTDTRAIDMADLVASFSETGIKQRIRDYREHG